MKKTISKLLLRVCDYSTLFVFAFSLVSIPLTMVSYGIFYKENIRFVEFLFLIPATAICFLLYKISVIFTSKSEKFLIAFAVIAPTICYLLLIFSFDTIPSSDYGLIWNGAVKMAKDSFVDGKIAGTYFYFVPYQIGMTFLESLFIRIFGESFFVLQILNILLLNTISYLIYYISKLKFGREAAVFTYVFTAFFFSYLLTVSQFTNHHIALALMLAAYIFIEKGKIYGAVISGVLLGILNFLRPIGIVCIIAVAVYLIYKLATGEKALRCLLCFLLILAPYFGIMKGLDAAMIESGYTDMAVSQLRLPYVRFVRGFNGDFNWDKFKDFDNDIDKLNEYQLSQVKEKLATPLQTSFYVLRKMTRFLGDVDYQFENTFNHTAGIWQKYPYRAYYLVSWFQYALYVVTASIGYWLYRKRKQLSIYHIFFLGYIAVHIFIEAFSSYRFQMYPFMLMMTGYGAYEINKWVFERKIREKTLDKA